MKLYKEASLMMLPTSVKDGKLYSIFPQPKPLSGELVTNGEFDTDSDWTKGTGWTISDGKAKVNGTNTFLEQPSVIKQSAFYKASFTISDYVSGDCRIAIGGYSTDPVFNANGDYNVYVESNAASNTRIYIYAQNASNFSIDNLSIVEVDQLDADFTFSRGSNLAATRINEQGLIEKGRENLFLQSNNFDTSPWGGSSTIFTSGQLGYDGSNDAWLLTHPLSTNSTFQANTNSGVQTFSIYAKSDGSTGIRLYAFGNANTNAYFDLNNGTVRTASNEISSNIVSVGNGWYRCSITFNQTNTMLRIYTTNNATTPAAGSVYIQDAQLEVGLVATDYIESGATTGKAGVLEDLPRLDWSGSCPSLLLEPQRANLITYSEGISTSAWTDNKTSNTSVTANATVSPEGVQNATEIDFTTTGGAEIYDQFSNIASSMHIGSVFLKNNDVNFVQCELIGGVPDILAQVTIDLRDGTLSEQVGDYTPTIEDYGNGWWRVALGDTANASVATPAFKLKSVGSNIGSFYAYGAQAEAGSYATSYIPTHGTSVTRSAEANVGSFNGDEIFSDSYTAMVDLVIPHKGTTDTGAGWGARVVEGSTSASNWSWVLVHQSSIQINLITKTSGGGSNSNLINYTFGDRIKIIVRSDGYYFVNGTKYTLSGGGLQSAEPVEIGFGRIGNSAFSSGETTEVNQALVFPTALSDNECINLTTI
jgi:hypothetical protein